MIYQLMTDKQTVFVRAAYPEEARRVVAAETENDIWKDISKAPCDPVEPDGKPKMIAWFDDDKMGI